MRVTIGDVSVWSIAAAQAEARCLQILIDSDNAPRQVKADKAAAKEAARIERGMEVRINAAANLRS